MSVWKTLTDTSNNPVYVNVDQVAYIAPVTNGSRIVFSGPTSEGHPVSVVVTAAPATILSGETLS
jgi:hypothetical protein